MNEIERDREREREREESIQTKIINMDPKSTKYRLSLRSSTSSSKEENQEQSSRSLNSRNSSSTTGGGEDQGTTIRTHTTTKSQDRAQFRRNQRQCQQTSAAAATTPGAIAVGGSRISHRRLDDLDYDDVDDDNMMDEECMDTTAINTTTSSTGRRKALPDDDEDQLKSSPHPPIPQPPPLLVAAHLIQTVEIDPEETDHIKQQAQEDAERRLIQQAVKATDVTSKTQGNGEVKHANGRRWLTGMTVLTLVFLLGVVAGTVVHRNKERRSHDAKVPAPTPAPIETFFPTIGGNSSFTSNTCSGAVKLILGSSSSSETLLRYGSTIGFTNAPIGLVTCGPVTEIGIAAWYKVIGDGQRWVASTCDHGSFDTQLSIYTDGGTASASSCTERSLTCVASNDQLCGPFGDQSKVAFETQQGQEYYILVHGYRAAVGDCVLTLDTLPINDQCSNPEYIELPPLNGMTSTSLTVFGSTLGGTTIMTDTNVGACGTATITTTSGAWYILNSTSLGNDIMNYVWSATLTHSQDTGFLGQVSIFTGPSCANLTCLAGEGTSGLTVDWQATSIADVSFWIYVQGVDSTDQGDFVLLVEGREVMPEFSVPGLGGSAKIPLGNFVCVPAIPIGIGETISNSTSNIETTVADIIPTSCGNNVFVTAPGRWYVVLGTGNPMTASTCSSSLLALSFDTQISIFQGNCSSLECVDGNDQALCENQSTVSWFTVKDRIYYILGTPCFFADGESKHALTRQIVYQSN